MKETAAILDKLSDSLADIYAARAMDGVRAQWRDVMARHYRYTAEESRRRRSRRFVGRCSRRVVR